MTTIFCDEAGNTGENVLDAEQPSFVLASNDYTVAEAKDLLAHVVMPGGGEPKFSALKKSVPGRGKLAALFADPRLNKTRIATYTIVKKYFVYTKMVDLVVETLMHQDGLDLYEQGANIALSNVLYWSTPLECGEELTNRMLDAFVKMMRYRTHEHIDNYFRIGKELLGVCTTERLHTMLFPYFARELFDKWFPEIPLLMEPAIPTLFMHVVEWGKRKTERFDVIHDRSKPVLATQDSFMNMLAGTGERSEKIGYDKRKYHFPLRATRLEQADSTQHPQIQIADICAGATAHYMRQRIMNETVDELSEMIRALGCVEWSIGGIAPTLDLTPEQLGMDGGGDVPIDPLYERFGRGRT